MTGVSPVHPARCDRLLRDEVTALAPEMESVEFETSTPGPRDACTPTRSFPAPQLPGIRHLFGLSPTISASAGSTGVGMTRQTATEERMRNTTKGSVRLIGSVLGPQCKSGQICSFEPIPRHLDCQVPSKMLSSTFERESAAELGLSAHHAPSPAQVFTKLGARNRTEALRQGTENGSGFRRFLRGGGPQESVSERRRHRHRPAVSGTGP